MSVLASRSKTLILLSLLHITVIAASNYLVQFPFDFLGFHFTWGAISYPFIFLATDLTVRVFGAPLARRIVFVVMFPALIASYFFSVGFRNGTFTGWESLASADVFILRIVIASFTAYICGQLLDIFVFRRLVALPKWWIAPAASTILGNLVDTFVFFSVAFAASPDPYMSTHWLAIATTDYACKLVFCVLLFVPVYGVVIEWLKAHLPQTRQNPV